MGKVIGVDLGTTNSCVAVLEGSSVQIIPNNMGGRTTPSVVAFTEKGERLLGQIAKRQSVTNATNTLYAVKRLMGRRYDSAEVQKLRSVLSYTLAASENGDVCVSALQKEYSPPEVSAMLLQHLKSMAEEFIGEEVKEAVITVPAYFDDSQRQATKDAGKIAGLEVRRILSEPTAAALAYGLGKREKERVAIFDLGGGTFDISILELNGGVFEVLATCGDSFLGGEDFDQQIIEWMMGQFRAETGLDLGKDILARQRLKETAEKAKCDLSAAEESKINLPFISADAHGPKHLDKVLTRKEFEALVRDLIERTTRYCEKALADAKLTADEIDKVILVGGQTRTPAVARHVEKIFGQEPSSEVNPDEVVAVGAAMQGGILEGEIKDIVLLDVLPLSLGVETHGGLFTKIIEHNSTIPLKKSAVFTTVADNQEVVEVHVLQGERELVKFNRSLARFSLVGIGSAPRGAPQIEVTFDIDANGIVSVSATDKVSGREQAIRISPTTGLSQEEIQRMIMEAKQFAASDLALKELTEMRNRIKGHVSSLSRTYSEYGWLLDNEKQEMIKDTLQAAKALPEDEGDVDLIKELLGKLDDASSNLTSAMFRAPEGVVRENGQEGSEEDLQQIVRSALNQFEPKS